MCRLLLVRSDNAFSIAEQLRPFAAISRDSREYQGHGWGCAWRTDGVWTHYRDIQPIWEHSLGAFGNTDLLIAHARSAFRDEGIVVENNMPFGDQRRVFAFNGELRGVRIKEQGRIGAEKIFNTVLRFDQGDLLAMLERGVKVIERRTRYVRAMNIIMAEDNDVVVASRFSEDPDYFQMRRTRLDDRSVLCSEVWPGTDAGNWQRIPNGACLRV